MGCSSPFAHILMQVTVSMDINYPVEEYASVSRHSQLRDIFDTKYQSTPTGPITHSLPSTPKSLPLPCPRGTVKSFWNGHPGPGEQTTGHQTLSQPFAPILTAVCLTARPLPRDDSYALPTSLVTDKLSAEANQRSYYSGQSFGRADVDLARWVFRGSGTFWTGWCKRRSHHHPDPGMVISKFEGFSFSFSRMEKYKQTLRDIAM